MTPQDLRWLQRFDNYQRALLVLDRGVQLAQTRRLSELEQPGLIIRCRNQSSHIHNLEQAQVIARDVIARFHGPSAPSFVPIRPSSNLQKNVAPAVENSDLCQISELQLINN